MQQPSNTDFTRAVFDARDRTNSIYSDTRPAGHDRSSERRATDERRQSVPWVVDSNDRRSGYDRRTGFDRRGNRASA